jgi:hypothetical protein
MAISPWSVPQPDFHSLIPCLGFELCVPLAKALLRLILGVAQDTMTGYYAANGGL